MTSLLHWCPHCQIPTYESHCALCGTSCEPFTTDVRPVFPEERLLVEILMGSPLAYVHDSVWNAAGDRYYVNGKRITFSTAKHHDVDASLIREQLAAYSSQNSYEAFDKYIGRFVQANAEHLQHISGEAISYIHQVSSGYDTGNMFVSFSGGKDSAVVSDLVLRGMGRADVLHIFGNTTLEFPQTLQYVEDFRKEHPRTPMLRAENTQQDFFNLCEQFGPPSRLLRWCCTIFKTGYIGNKINQTFGEEKRILSYNGIRRSESKSRNNYDRDSVSPKISKQQNASPIIDWFDFDIWLYILSRGIRFNDAYRLGYNRVGCWLCPNNNKWAQFLSRLYLPEESARFRQILMDFAVKTGKKDPDDYVDNNGWKARSGGAGMELSKNVVVDFAPCATDAMSFTYELNKPITQELYELFKPFGKLDYAMGNARLGEVYVKHGKTGVPLLKLQGRCGQNVLRITILQLPIAGRSKVVEVELKFKCQITKYQLCVGCHACENACKYGAISLIKRGDSDSDYIYKINDAKCVHCFACINHYEGGCYMRRVLLPRGKDYVEHGGRQNKAQG